MKLVIQFNLETHFAFPDYVKAFDRVKRNKLFEILQSKTIPNLLSKSIIKIYSGNEIKARINNQLSEEHTLNRCVRHGCPLSPTLLNIYVNEKNVKCNPISREGIALSTSIKINTLFFRRRSNHNS
jgi:hypothetical protein